MTGTNYLSHLATTGMRRGEAFEIDREEIEDGIRFVTIEQNRAQSLRRVPFPADLLPYLPPKITGQLIPGRMDAASKRLRAWLSEIGITDPDKAQLYAFIPSPGCAAIARRWRA